MDYGLAFGFQPVQNTSISHDIKEYQGSILYLLVQGILDVISMLFTSNLFSSLANRQITLNPPQNQKEILFNSLNLTPPDFMQLEQDLSRCHIHIDDEKIETIQQLQKALEKFQIPDNKKDALHSALNQAILSKHYEKVVEMHPGKHCKQKQNEIFFTCYTSEKTVEQKSSYTIHDVDSGGAPVKEISKRVQVHSVADFRDPERIKFKI